MIDEITYEIEKLEIMHEPGKLDLAFEAAQAAPNAVQNHYRKKFLFFRPYIDPMTIRPYKPPDKGYFYKFYNGGVVSLVRFTLEDNGFRQADERNSEWSFMWATSSIKMSVY